MNKPKLFFVTGISGSGKTTVGRELTKLGEVAFDSKIQKGLFRFSDKDNKQPTDYQPNNSSWRERYHWVLNKTMLDELIEDNRFANRVFLCGGADDLIQYWPLGKKVFLLRVDAVTMLNRLQQDKRDNYFGKDKETQARLCERLNRFQNKMIAAGVVEIDATKPLAEVVSLILTQAI